MKCLECGEKILGFNKQQRFCCKECGIKFRARISRRPLTIQDNFEIFKRVVEHSNTVEKFNQLYEQYFMERKPNENRYTLRRMH